MYSTHMIYAEFVESILVFIFILFLKSAAGAPRSQKIRVR
jgi:hypothetical protein